LRFVVIEETLIMIESLTLFKFCKKRERYTWQNAQKYG
jgi:hypothetical protein